eukprot:47306-Chlamydomonas_euryale.AAC.1
MAAFADSFRDDLGCLVEEVVVGTGPCGELRYPSYVESHGWMFPGRHGRRKPSPSSFVLLPFICVIPTKCSHTAGCYKNGYGVCR